MSRNHHYHQPNAPNSPSDESDSDLELDLQELGPHTLDSGHGRIGTHYDSKVRIQRRIPLRNLRQGTSRGVERRNHNLDNDDENTNVHGDLSGQHNENTISDDSHESFSAVEDEAPLLNRQNNSGPEFTTLNKDRRGVFSSLRFPPFLSAGSNQSSSQRANVEGGEKGGTSRIINIGQYPPPKFPPNAVSNAKYTAWSFLPRTLYNEFSFFYNLYFLLVALSQIIPSLRIGYLSTYIDPLAFVLTITLGKEALDDIARRKRDSEANREEYTVLRFQSSQGSNRKEGIRPRSKKAKAASNLSKRTRLDAIEEEEERVGDDHVDSLLNLGVDEIKIKSRDLKVGDVVKLSKDQRTPADLVILKSYPTEVAATVYLSQSNEAESLEASDSYAATNVLAQPDSEYSTTSNTSAPKTIGHVGETFIRTDQLDGETDWKLRLASPLTQSLDPRDFTQLRLVAAKPDRKVNEFFGTVDYAPLLVASPAVSRGAGAQSQNDSKGVQTAPLTIDNTAWANTVLASNATVLAVVVYTGAQTRQALSTSSSRSKTGLLDSEINNLAKILFALTLTLSVVLVALEGLESRGDQKWYIAIMRFLILFSTIIPISLRVNLDMGKSVYAWFIERDQGIPATVVRTSTIPEELGRIEYLLSDKTGTLTQNGTYPCKPTMNSSNITLRDGAQKNSCWYSLLCQ